MKHLFDLKRLHTFLESQTIVLSRSQKEQLLTYQHLIEKGSKRQNLVSKNDIFYLIERHFLPSIYLSCCLPDNVSGKLIDVGSGAGFPGIIIKILRPEISVSLLDSSHKKVLFLEEVCEQLDLECQIINQRCELYQPDRSEDYHIIVSRAVARLKLLWEWTGHLIRSGGELFTLKGGDFQQEIDELSEHNLKIEVFKPGNEWLAASNYLKQKYVIRMEK